MNENRMNSLHIGNSKEGETMLEVVFSDSEKGSMKAANKSYKFC